MTSTITLLQPLLPTGIKDVKHLHVVLIAIDYALKDFDDKHRWSIATIVNNCNKRYYQTLTCGVDDNWLFPERFWWRALLIYYKNHCQLE